MCGINEKDRINLTAKASMINISHALPIRTGGSGQMRSAMRSRSTAHRYATPYHYSLRLIKLSHVHIRLRLRTATSLKSLPEFHCNSIGIIVYIVQYVRNMIGEYYNILKCMPGTTSEPLVIQPHIAWYDFMTLYL